MLISDTKRKLEHLHKVVKKNDKYPTINLNINCKKMECMFVTKSNCPTYRLQAADTKINKRQTFLYLGSVLKEDATCKIEIWMSIVTAKYAFHKLTKLLRNKQRKYYGTVTYYLSSYMVLNDGQTLHCWRRNLNQKKSASAGG